MKKQMKFKSTRSRVGCAVAAFVGLSSVAVLAQENPAKTDQYELQQQRLNQQAQMIETLNRRLEELELRNSRGKGLGGDQPSRLAAPAAAASNVDASVQTSQAQQAATPKVGQEQQKQQQEDQSAAQKLAGQQAPLFERKFSLDTGITYIRQDRKQLALSGFYALDAIFLGKLSVEQVKANTLVVDTTARYGLTDRWSVDANIPLVARNSLFVSGGAGMSATSQSEASVNTTKLGDVSLGASYQIFKEASDGYDMVGSLKLRLPTGLSPFGIDLVTPDKNNGSLNVPEKLPTGNGVYSLQAVTSFIKTIDPMVLFANVGFIYNIKRNVKDLGTTPGQPAQPGSVKLGDSLLLGGGTAFAVNDSTALSFGVNMQFTANSRTKPEGGTWSKVVGSKGVGATLNMGVNHAFSKKSSVSTTLGVGLTSDVPNFTLGMRFPYSF
jgi:hypothetical protein